MRNRRKHLLIHNKGFTSTFIKTCYVSYSVLSRFVIFDEAWRFEKLLKSLLKLESQKVPLSGSVFSTTWGSGRRIRIL